MADSDEGSLTRTNDQVPRRTRLFRRIERHVQGRTVGGLMELAPLLVTIVVMVFVIGKADSFIRPLGSLGLDRPSSMFQLVMFPPWFGWHNHFM